MSFIKFLSADIMFPDAQMYRWCLTVVTCTNDALHEPRADFPALPGLQNIELMKLKFGPEIGYFRQARGAEFGISDNLLLGGGNENGNIGRAKSLFKGGQAAMRIQKFR